MPSAIVRLLCDARSQSRTTRDAATGERPFYWRGSSVRFQLALVDNGQFITAGGVGEIIVEVKALTARSTDDSFLRKTFVAADCDNTFTASDWEGGGKQLLDASFTVGEAAILPGSYRVIVRHIDGDGEENTFLSAELQVLEPQSGSEGLEPPPIAWSYLDAVPVVRYDTPQVLTEPQLEVAWSNLQLEALDNTLPWKRPGCILGMHFRNTTLVGNKITAWQDLSGNGKVIAQATDSFRATWTDSGAELPAGGCYYTIAGGLGITNQSFTAIWIGRQQTGILNSNGHLFKAGPTGPGIYFDPYGSFLANSGGGSGGYSLPLQMAPGGISSYAVASGTTGTTVIANGCTVNRVAYNSGTSTINHLFASDTISSGMWMPTIAVLIFNRKLGDAEIREITSYFGADNTPGGLQLYNNGSSTSLGTGATSYATSLMGRTALALGARLSSNGVNGALFANISAASQSSFIPTPGRQNVHVVIPATNDLASQTGQASNLQTYISNYCGKIRTADPFARIVIVTIQPRKGSITSPQTEAGLETDRQTVNTWIRANYATIADAIADVGADPTIGDLADVDNTTYYSADKIHFTDAGTLVAARILVNAIRGL